MNDAANQNRDLSAATQARHKELVQQLLGLRSHGGGWRGRLSASALATAVAGFALRTAEAETEAEKIRQSEAWLVRTQLEDGSWGDAPQCSGNLSTTLLVLAFLAGSESAAATTATDQGRAWVITQIGDYTPAKISTAILKHYGRDRTFSVPILTMCALAGLLGPAPECWRSIPALPYELAVLPHRFFRIIGLPVVSYALPALIAMGLARRRLGPASAWTSYRKLFSRPALKRLEQICPATGGFLEAAPLTGFVAMSLKACGHGEHPAVTKGLEFLRSSQRPDGSWPIDSDLAAWVTGLSVRALGQDIPPPAAAEIRDWILQCQFQTRHPYTGAAAGGWAWTNRGGGVPDADDTAGALLALHELQPENAEVRKAAAAGLNWLLDLMNKDGGLPTFCRGRGSLPFDQSCPDITAHALTAFNAWEPLVQDKKLRNRLRQGRNHACAYLLQSQLPDGSWQPLWFGNESAPGQQNPVYGTAKVIQGLVTVKNPAPAIIAVVARGAAWLTAAQHQDGGWGGAAGVTPSIEETALAVSALKTLTGADAHAATMRGRNWLLQHLENISSPTPVGLYFASLWYAEDLYPLIFTVDALR